MKLDFHDPQSGGLSEQQTGGTLQTAGPKWQKSAREQEKTLVLAALCYNCFAITHLFTVRIDSRPVKTAFKHRYQHND